jgi:type IV pilus assembly protein PilA
MKMFRRSEGFTLVELMVVVLIIGILIAIAVPIFNAAKANAQQRTCQANLRTLEGAYQSYLASGATLPSLTYAALQTALNHTYVQTWPACPDGGNYGADFSVPSAVDVTCDHTGPTHVN